MPPLSATLQTEFATDGFDLGDAVGLLGHAMDLVGPALGVDIDAGTEVGVKTPSGTRRWIRVYYSPVCTLNIYCATDSPKIFSRRDSSSNLRSLPEKSPKPACGVRAASVRHRSGCCTALAVTPCAGRLPSPVAHRGTAEPCRQAKGIVRRAGRAPAGAGHDEATSNQVKQSSLAVAERVGRPVQYLASPKVRKDGLARDPGAQRQDFVPRAGG